MGKNMVSVTLKIKVVVKVNEKGDELRKYGTLVPSK